MQRIYMLQAINLEDTEYAFRVAEKVLDYGFRVELHPMRMNRPQTLLILVWCRDDMDYAALVNELFRAIPDYNTH
jgi:hypothetical protein